MTVAELQECITVLLRLAAERGVNELHPTNDGYWTITAPEWRDVYAVSTPVPAVGSFADDQHELNKVRMNPERASAVDFERAAHLLRLLSDQIVE